MWPERNEKDSSELEDFEEMTKRNETELSGHVGLALLS
jgi:hypothetical protein